MNTELVINRIERDICDTVSLTLLSVDIDVATRTSASLAHHSLCLFHKLSTPNASESRLHGGGLQFESGHAHQVLLDDQNAQLSHIDIWLNAYAIQETRSPGGTS